MAVVKNFWVNRKRILDMAIPLVEEPKEYLEEFGTLENCYFGCGSRTKFWHVRTNQPICKDCAKKHKVSEVNKCIPDYKPTTTKEFMS